MSRPERAVALSLPLLMCGGCNAAFWGNLGVLGMTVGIFLGTVFLGRGETPTARSAGSAAESTTRS